MIKSVLKIADIDANQVSEEARKFLSRFIWYDDKVFQDDILSVAQAVQSEHFKQLPSNVQAELINIKKCTGALGAPYVRLLNETRFQTGEWMDSLMR